MQSLKSLFQIYQDSFVAQFPKQYGHTEGVLSVQHIPCKCSHKMALVTCPCAFRLRRLAQNKSRGPGARHFPCDFLHILNNSCDMSCNFDCAGLCKARNLAQTACQETSDRELVQRSCQETSYGDLVQRACQETSYRDLANRALTEILPEDLS